MARPRRSEAVIEIAQAFPSPTLSFRMKRADGQIVVQQAWRHAGGVEWRNLPVVAGSAPDWEPIINAATEAPRQ
jgi:hypothetical protein